MYESGNHVYLSGKVNGNIMIDHEAWGETICRIMLDVSRLSGVVDTVPVLCKKSLLDGINPHGDCQLYIAGQMRSYNRVVDGKSTLKVVAYAREIAPYMGTRIINEVTMTGFVCKEPTHRFTPRDCEISDVLLAVNRPYGQSDYIPCIMWGRNAMLASLLDVGAPITVIGRLQSRGYQKVMPDGGRVDKVAYEVSVSGFYEMGRVRMHDMMRHDCVAL